MTNPPRPTPHRRRRTLALLALALLALATPATAQPKVALVLGGGAARGTAHVGVLQTLTAAGVPIDMILGTSMGSLIGGLYAAGFSVDALAAVVDRVDPTGSAELLIPPRGGILDGAPLGMLLDALVEGRQLSDTPIPFYPVVIDLATGEPGAAPATGSLADGIRASTAIPVLFDPVAIDGRFYYDGGLKQTIPTSLARSLGASYVIAVDVTREIPFEPGNVQANFSRIVVSIVEEYNRDELSDTDVVLDPGLRDFSYMDFDLTADFVRAGARVAERELPRILTDLAALGIPLRPGGDPNRGRPINDGWEGRLQEAQRAVVTRARPWNLTFDLGLSPAASGERVTPSPVPVGSRVRLGVTLRDGFLGGGAVGIGYARSVTGGTDALRLQASYRLDADWRLFTTVDVETDGDAGVAVRGGASVRLGDAWTVSLAGTWPNPTIDVAAAYRAPGLWFDANAAWGAAGWWRGYGVAQAATGLGGAWDLRGRLFAGTATEGTPEAERFSVGPAIGLRGTPPDAFTASWATVANVALVRHLGDGAAVLEAATIAPSVWAFVDGALFAGGRTAAVGVGAGLEGRLFGFLPFALALDVGYGVATDSWRADLRWGATGPTVADR